MDAGKESDRWVSSQHWITLQGARVQGDALIMPVQEDFVDALLSDNPQSLRCRASVRVDGGAAVTHSVRLEPGLLSSTAAGAAPSAGGSSSTVKAAPAAVQPPPVQEAPEKETPPVQPAAPVHETPKQPEPASSTPADGKKSKTALWVALGVAVLLAAAAAAWFLMKGKGGAEEAAPEPVAAAPEQAQTLCRADALADADGMSFVQACVRDVQDSAQLLAVIHAARDQSKCDIAQRLYANRANAGDNLIAMAYAQEYNPAVSQGNSCFSPEAATAAYWYESILEREPEHAEARAALDALAK